MCGSEDPMLTIKEVPLCCSCDKGVTKYRFSYNSRSYRDYKLVRKESIKIKKMRVPNTFFKTRWLYIYVALDIPNGLEDVDKKEEKRIYLKKEVVTTSIGQQVNRIKQTGWSIHLTVAIQDLGMKKRVKCYNFKKMGHYAMDC